MTESREGCICEMDRLLNELEGAMETSLSSGTMTVRDHEQIRMLMAAISNFRTNIFHPAGSGEAEEAER